MPWLAETYLAGRGVVEQVRIRRARQRAGCDHDRALGVSADLDGRGEGRARSRARLAVVQVSTGPVTRAPPAFVTVSPPGSVSAVTTLPAVARFRLLPVQA